MTKHVRPVATLLLVGLLACLPADGATATDSLSAAATADDLARLSSVVDSILPIPVLLERFREGLAPTDTLAGASTSRDALVERFVRSLSAADSADLVAMAMSTTEFAWLYYPESQFTRPPYELGPEHAFLLIDQNSRKGLTRLLRRVAGVELDLAGYSCPPEPRREGPNSFWEGCTVQFRNPDGVVDTLRLFGAIWERDGRWKLVSYANEM